MISVSSLAKDFGAQTLFRDVSLQFNPGNRYGLVGANGSGKTTLLRILAGDEEASSGEVSIPRRLRLGVLRQDHYRYERDRIVDVVLMGHRELWQAMQRKDELLRAPRESFDADAYAELEDFILHHDGYAVEARAAEILEGLGIPADHHPRPLGTLSGGFKLRVLLAQTLASSPDALLLDEPTNHLDILSIRWLEKFLLEFQGVVVVVSHDHRFLDNVCTDIVDIDYETATLYPGNYSYFGRAKVEDRERREAELRRQEKKKAEHQAFVDRFRAKATKARQAQSKAKLIVKLEAEMVELPRSSRRYPRFRFEPRRPSGKRVVEVEGIDKSFGDKRVLSGVSLQVERGDRLAIIGPNGIGKSTLLEILMGRLEADRGRVEWGYETWPGYFAQDHSSRFKGASASATIESWLWESCPGEPIGFVRGKLGQVLFSGDEVHKKVGGLSGGEMARLTFCRLGVEQPNVLVLDEPTNHLDMEAIEALSQALEAYDGTLVFVSHDRWFVSRLANRILEINARGLNDFRGSYEEYLERCGDDHLDAESVLMRAREEKRRSRDQAARDGAAATDPEEARRRGQRRKHLEKSRDQATQAIDQAETRIHDINELFCDPSFFGRTPPREVKKLEREQEDLRQKVARLMAEWEAAEKELGELGG